jgi:hypothetical protein
MRGRRLTLDLPPGFAGLPLGDSAEETAAYIRDTARQLADRTGRDVTGELGTLAAVMAKRWIRLLGRFAVCADEPALATLALAVVPLGAEKSVPPRDPHASTRAVRLPIGPAQLIVRAGDRLLPSGARPELSAEFRVATPGALVVLTVTTNSEPAWPAVAAEAMRVATSMAMHSEVIRDAG